MLFLIVCFSFSFQSSLISNILCCTIYLIAGLVLFKKENGLTSVVLFFSPHIIPAIILFSNNGLFPEIFPLVLVSAILSFSVGHFVRLRTRAFYVNTILIFAFIGYVCFINLFLLPRLLLSKTQLTENYGSPHNDLQFYDQNSKVVKIKGEGIEVLNFWFVGCGICYPHNAVLNDIAKLYSKDEVSFYLIDQGNVDSFEKFSSLKSRWSNLQYLYDSAGRITSELGIVGAPHTIILSSGKVIHEHSGFNKEIGNLLKEEIIGTINSNLGERKAIANLTFDSLVTVNNLNVGDTLVQTISIRNNNFEKVRLINVKASCDCIVSEWTKEDIGKGDEGKVIVRYIAENSGHLDKTVIVETDLKDPFLFIRLTGDIN